MAAIPGVLVPAFGVFVPKFTDGIDCSLNLTSNHPSPAPQRQLDESLDTIISQCPNNTIFVVHSTPDYRLNSPEGQTSKKAGMAFLFARNQIHVPPDMLE